MRFTPALTILRTRTSRSSPVADTPSPHWLRDLYDWLFPEACASWRQTARRVLFGFRHIWYVGRYGTNGLVDQCYRCRALENIATWQRRIRCSLKHYPPYSWPGGSHVVDYDGRYWPRRHQPSGRRIVTAP